jgi:hypothetical protein
MKGLYAASISIATIIPLGEDKKGKRIFKKPYSGRKPEDARKALDEAVHPFLVTLEDFGTERKCGKKQTITDAFYIEAFKPALGYSRLSRLLL